MKRTIMISTGITRAMGETPPASDLQRTADTLDAMVEADDVSVVDLRGLPASLRGIADHMSQPPMQAMALTQSEILALVRLITAARDALSSIDDDADQATARANELRDAITAAEHALGLPPSDGWEGDRDPDGAPLRYKNHYACDCGAEWDDEWSCTCDDPCPVCDAACTPMHSIDLMETQEAAHGDD